MRCFISLKLPKEVRDYLSEIQEEIKKENLFHGKFTSPENLHLTLKFLGETDEKKLKEIEKRLEKIEFREFAAELRNAGFFGNKKYGIIWIRLSNCENLQRKVDGSLSGLFKPEDRFMSHLTIARTKKIQDKKKLITFLNNLKISPIKFKVAGFYLMNSRLFKDGPEYSVLKEFSGLKYK